MSLSPLFQRDLFGMDAGLSGWPTDGLDEPPLPSSQGVSADLRTSPAVQALRVALGLAPAQRQREPLEDEAAPQA
jgi:hypothetical protein